MTEHHDWFSADRPIANRAEDKLGRRSFAEAIAKAIRGWQGRDSLVIALYGPWGSGKSSIKNMVLDALREAASGKRGPTVAEFDPWQFANREQLTEAFFDQIGIALGRGCVASEKEKKQLLRRWRVYAASLKAGAGLIDLIRKPGAVFLFLIGVFIAGAAKVNYGAVSWTVGLIFAGFAILVFWSSKFAQAVTGLLEARVEANRKSLDEVKAELSEALRKLKAPLLVVMDDVDRLTPSEVQKLFQLIKANADFPNVVYLALFERDIIEKNIETVSRVSGRDYLEKIVQVGFDMPVLERPRLHRVLFEGLNQLLAEASVSRRFNKHRWGNLFQGGLQQYFTNLRDVNRFLSTLSFHVSLFRAEKSFEVNPVDLIGLEVLRVFEPGVYTALPLRKDLLTSTRDREVREEEARLTLSGLADLAELLRREAVREILKQLFPPAEWAFGGTRYAGGDEAWSRDLRVCSRNVFDRYFHFAIPEGDISQQEIDAILDATNDRNRLRDRLRALKARGMLPVALDRLEAYKETISLDHAEAFLTALFDVCDNLPEGAGFFEIEPMMHAGRIIYWYLRREPDTNRKRTILEAAIRQTEGVSLSVHMVAVEAQGHERGRQPEQRLVDEEGLAALKALCVTKIEAVAASGRLAETGELLDILYRWRDWAGEQPPRQYVENLVQDVEGAVKLVRAFLQRSRSHGLGDYVTRENWYINLGNIETFVAFETVETALQKVSPESLSETDRRAVEAFRRAVERRRQGKPDFGTTIGMDE